MKRRKNLWGKINMAKNNVNIDLDDNDDFIPSPLALNDFSHFFQYFDNRNRIYKLFRFQTMRLTMINLSVILTLILLSKQIPDVKKMT